MAIDLFGMMLTGAVSWGIGKILDVVVECDRCGEEMPQNVGNVQMNTLGCSNCWKEVDQFTNACDFTIRPDKHIAHIGLKLTGGWKWNYDPNDTGFFPSKYEGWVFFSKQMRALNMQSRQYVLEGKIKDYDTGRTYTKENSIYRPRYNDSQWYNQSNFSLYAYDIPKEKRDNRIYAVDLIAKSRYGDVLCEDRLLAQLWE